MIQQCLWVNYSNYLHSSENITSYHWGDNDSYNLYISDLVDESQYVKSLSNESFQSSHNYIHHNPFFSSTTNYAGLNFIKTKHYAKQNNLGCIKGVAN